MADFDRTALARALHGTFRRFMDAHGGERIPITLALDGALGFVAPLISDALAQTHSPEQRQEWMARIHTHLDSLVAAAAAVREAEDEDDEHGAQDPRSGN